MAPTGHPNEEDGKDKLRKIKKCKGKTKHRHKFTQEELEQLNEMFRQNPYPDFSAREKLAKQFKCESFVIYTWFQNKRARLPCEERQRIFTMWKQQSGQGTDNQNNQTVCSGTNEQHSSIQETLEGGAAFHPLERPTPMPPGQQQESFSSQQIAPQGSASGAHPDTTSPPLPLSQGLQQGEPEKPSAPTSAPWIKESVS